MPHPRCSRAVAFLLAATTSVAGTVALAPVATAAIPAGSTVRVNVASDGTQANDYSALPAISSDGNVVVFTSSATNLVPGYPGNADESVLYAHDLSTGATTAVGVAADGRNAPDAGEFGVSGSGSRVVFISQALGVMAPGAPMLCTRYIPRRDPVPDYCINLFVRDRATNSTVRVSVGADGSEPNGRSDSPRMSGDGRYVAFRSEASNLVAGDVNGASDIFVRDLQTGTTTRVDPGNGAPGSTGSFDPAISADGRWIAFVNPGFGRDMAPVPDGGSTAAILLHDRVSGTTTAVDPSPADGGPHELPLQLSLSGDGNLVGFGSLDRTLVAGDANNNYDVYVYDRTTRELTMADRAADGRQAEQADRIHFSADGRYALFRTGGPTSLAATVPGPRNAYGYVREIATGALTLATVASDGTAPDASTDVGFAGISGDGARVAFWSDDADLVAGDTNNNSDIFVRALRDVATPPGAASATVSGGGTVTTDPTGAGATPEVPVQTAITAPAAVSGAVSVTPQPVSTTAPTGFEILGKQLVLEGPAATPQSPYQVSFTVDAATLGTVAAADLQVFRNGAAVADCTDPTAAVPDPCVVSRRTVSASDPDAVITVRTSHFSTWNVGALRYTVSGPFAPVNAYPTVNTSKAGSAVPIKFRLGGNRGLSVLAAGYPVVRKLASCTGTTDEVEQTVALTTPVLTYDAASTTYSYVWKTSKTLTGCMDLVLRFRDGAELRSRFTLR